jgi:uncharacterized protein with GYD domain
MPKYLTLFRYTHDSYKGLLKEKASARVAAVKKGLESIGGRLESAHWFASGEYTGMLIYDCPDAASQVALLTTTQAAGVSDEARSFELLTSEEVDTALAKTVSYRPPGAKASKKAS